MNDLRRIFEQQAARQRSLRRLSWPEKIRMAEEARKAVEALRDSGRKPNPDPS